MPESPAPFTEAEAQHRAAVCLCGGGITGAMYELGALWALDDFFSAKLPSGEPAPRWPFDSTRFDVFIGTSAGSFVATAVCAGISPKRLARAVLGLDHGKDLLPAH